MLFYCCTNNANRSRVSLRSIFSNCHVIFHYLHSFVHASLQWDQLSHSEHAMLCVTYNVPCNAEVGRKCYQQTLITINVVDDTAYPHARAPSSMRTTVADKHNFLAVRRLSSRLIDQSKKRIPTCIWRP